MGQVLKGWGTWNTQRGTEGGEAGKGFAETGGPQFRGSRRGGIQRQDRQLEEQSLPPKDGRTVNFLQRASL